jgi:hypothetical protein
MSNKHIFISVAVFLLCSFNAPAFANKASAAIDAP